MCQQEWQAVRMEQVVQARSPGLMELDIVLCLPSLCSGQCFLGKTRMKLGLVCGSRKAMVQEAEAPRRWGKLVPSNEKKGVELQGPVTSSDIGKTVLFLGTTGKWIS